MTQMVQRLSAVQETRVPFLGWKDPLEKEMAAHSSILAGKSHGLRSLVGYCSWGHKELDTTERDFTFTLNLFLQIGIIYSHICFHQNSELRQSHISV